MARQLTQHWKLAILWTLSLVMVAVVSSLAQAPQSPPPPGGLARPIPLLQLPTVISGSDVGFRVEQTRDGIQIGRVVVRIGGTWVDTAAPPAAAR
jgi:hypothetical protein